MKSQAIPYNLQGKSPISIIKKITTDSFLTAMEILQIVDVLERLNLVPIVENLDRSGAARAAIVVRNSLIARLVTIASGVFSPVREGDRHLKLAVKLLGDVEARRAIEHVGSSAGLDLALHKWEALEADPRLLILKHFRNKFTAHTAVPIADIPLPQYDEMFAFSREVAALMESFADATGVLPETLSATEPLRIQSARIFWRPWEF
jgi:hypothetical protein